MRIITYKGIDNDPEMWGLNVNYIIVFFMSFIFHVMIISMLYVSLGLLVLILEAFILVIFYKVYMFLREKTLKNKKSFLTKTKIKKQNNLYSLKILNHENTIN